MFPNPKLSIFSHRLIFANESLKSDIDYSATPQINVDEGPSDQFKDKWKAAKAKIQKAKKDEATMKKDEAPDKWVRLVIWLAFNVDIGGEGTIEEALASLTEDQKTALYTYVEGLKKLAEEDKKEIKKDKG